MPSKKTFRPPETVSVSVHRNGAELQATVKWEDVQLVLQEFLEVYRRATKQYPELIQDLPHVGGSSIQYVDDWDSPDNRRKRIGFLRIIFRMCVNSPLLCYIRGPMPQQFDETSMNQGPVSRSGGQDVTPAPSVPGSGKDVGGTDSPRVTVQTIQAGINSTPSGGKNQCPAQSFTDGSV